MNGTLPLFEDLPPEEPRARRRKASRRASSSQASLRTSSLQTSAGRDAERAAPGRGVATAGDRHLRAVWKLSRSMWRYPEHSPEQTRAGLAICHHLQALLANDGGSP